MLTASPPTLRVVWDDELPTPVASTETESPPGDLSPQITLSAFYEHYFSEVWFPEHNSDEKTIVKYSESIDHWKRITTEAIGREPTLAEIDRKLLATFQAGLRKLPGRAPKGQHRPCSPYTVKGHFNRVYTILRQAGPDNEDLKLLPRIPKLERHQRPQVIKSPPKPCFTEAEFQQIFKAVEVATRPIIHGVTPADWWRSLLGLAWFTGARRESLLGVNYSDLKGNQLAIDSLIHKGSKADLISLPDPIVFLLQRINTGSRQRIHAWSQCVPCGSTNQKSVDDQFERIVAAAGLPEDKQRLKFQALRRSVLTELARRDMQAARVAANHSGMQVLVDHYVNQRILTEAQEQRDLGFLTTRRDDPRQQRLF